MICRPIAGLLVCAMLATPAIARPSSSTKYVYYPVGGKTAGDIYNAMLRLGPHVNGEKAYADTIATTSQDGKLVQGKSCQIQNYRLHISFVIRLPRLQSTAGVPATDLARWRQFEGFVRRHEEGHRTIWMGCANRLEAEVRAIHASTCGEADKRAAALWEKARAACSARHDIYDAAEARRLVKHPFVQYVFSHKARTASAARVP